MARKKVTKTGVSEVHSAATRETALELANMFNDFAIEKNGLATRYQCKCSLTILLYVARS